MRVTEKLKRLPKWIWSVALAAVMTLGNIVTKSSQDSEGNYPFNAMSIVLLSEIGKLSLSLFLLWNVSRHQKEPFRVVLAPILALQRHQWLYLLPAFLYFIQNNLGYLAFSLMDPGTFQVLNNMKVITTAIVQVVFLRRPLTRVQWAAALLIFFGMSVSSLPDDGSGALRVSPAGLTASFVLAVLSAIAGATNDYAMKYDKKESIHIQNIRLYLFGLIFNLIGSIMQPGTFDKGLLTGFNTEAWILVCLGSAAGLIVSAIMKYASVLAKVYSVSVTMILTVVTSSLLFNTELTITMIMGASIVSIALYLHGSDPKNLTSFPNQREDHQRTEDTENVKEEEIV